MTNAEVLPVCSFAVTVTGADRRNSRPNTDTRLDTSRSCRPDRMSAIGKRSDCHERPNLGDSGMAGMGMKADRRLSRRGGGLLTCRLNLSAGPTQNVRNQETEAHCRMAGMGRNADWSPWKPCDPKVTVNGRTKLKCFDCTVNISSSYPYKGKIF